MLLPAPLRPMMPTTSPAATSKLTSWRAARNPLSPAFGSSRASSVRHMRVSRSRSAAGPSVEMPLVRVARRRANTFDRCSTDTRAGAI